MAYYHTLIISATPSPFFLPWRQNHCPSSKVSKWSLCTNMKHRGLITNGLCSAAFAWSACFLKRCDLQRFEKGCYKVDWERMVEDAGHGAIWLGKCWFRVWPAEWAVPCSTSFRSCCITGPGKYSYIYLLICYLMGPSFKDSNASSQV